MTSMVGWYLATQKERAEVVRFYIINEGWSYRQLAEHIGVTRNVIAGICNRHGIKTGTSTNAASRAAARRQTSTNVVPFRPKSALAREEAVAEMAKKIKVKRKISEQSMVIAIMAGKRESPPDYAPPKVDRSVAWLPLPESQPVSIVDANAQHCRWPISEDNHTWCGGHVKHGSIYCTGHHAIAYRPAPPINFDKRRRNGSAA